MICSLEASSIKKQQFTNVRRNDASQNKAMYEQGDFICLQTTNTKIQNTCFVGKSNPKQYNVTERKKIALSTYA